jgi:hypothetical protein
MQRAGARYLVNSTIVQAGACLVLAYISRNIVFFHFIQGPKLITQSLIMYVFLFL